MSEPTIEELTIAEDEIMQALDLYDGINWDRYEANNAGKADSKGEKLDRHNLAVRVLFMAASLFSTRHEPEVATQKAREYLNNAPGFEELVMTLLATYESVKGSEPNE